MIPNLADERAPDGGEDDAVVLREVGERPQFDFQPRDHLGLSAPYEWIDMERGARLSGARFAYRRGDVALLELALYRWAITRLTVRGFEPVLPPVLVREQAMYGTGFLPTEESNLYRLDERDGLYLTGTSEVALAGLHMGEILDELPLRYIGYTTNFRREAGAAGKDTRGMFRVHQFDKVEMYVYTTPEDSPAEHDRLLAIEEELVGELGIPVPRRRHRRRRPRRAGRDASSTSRRGSRRRSATARSPRARTRPTTRRTGSRSASGPQGRGRRPCTR